MNLSTVQYLDSISPLPEKADRPNELGWTEVTKGLFSILCGYLLSLLNVVAIFGIIWFVSGGFKKPVSRITGDDFTVLLIGGAVLFFTSLCSSYLILRGKWRCTMNAPERGSAKWFMFASMICIFMGPAINITSALAVDAKSMQQNRDHETVTESKSVTIHYFERMRDRNLTAFLKLGGALIASCGLIFFVLFLRAVHNCLGSFMGARFTELYLLFLGLLVAGSISLLLDSQVKIRVDLLLCLAVGWLTALVWYLLLILGAIFSISAYVNTPRDTFQM